MKPTLAILAAGMGSRYGGLKQIDTVGDNGESIIDFTIYDAIESGFKKLVLIIRKEHEEAFEEHLVKKIRPFIEVEYAYQDLKNIPDPSIIPEGREKPWGTSHALLACKGHINDPFVICNADDYYGKDAFKKVLAYLENDIDDQNFCMVGYKLANTLSDHGTVTRGFCRTDENNCLTHIRETMNIRKNNGQAEVEENGVYQPVDNNTPVSMNFWGFTPAIFDKVEKIFNAEIAEGVKANPLKYEALLPNYIGELISNNECSVRVLTSNDSWFGVTYREDKPVVVEKFARFKEEGLYPKNLWL